MDRSGITINCNLGTDTKKLQQVVDVPVALGMRYAQPSIEKGIQDLVDQGVNEIILFPLYPQYAMSTTETVSVKAEEVRKKKFPAVKIKYVKPFTTVTFTLMLLPIVSESNYLRSLINFSFLIMVYPKDIFIKQIIQKPVILRTAELKDLIISMNTVI